MEKVNFVSEITKELKKRNNPEDVKPSIIGVVVKIEPVIIVQIENGDILLTENEELEISEWFKFRCNINKTNALTQDVPNNLNNALNVAETHSYGGAPCNMPNAITCLVNAINAVNNELLALKCNLNIGDFVVIASLEENNRFILIDKV